MLRFLLIQCVTQIQYESLFLKNKLLRQYNQSRCLLGFFLFLKWLWLWLRWCVIFFNQKPCENLFWNNFLVMILIPVGQLMLESLIETDATIFSISFVSCFKPFYSMKRFIFYMFAWTLETTSIRTMLPKIKKEKNFSDQDENYAPVEDETRKGADEVAR